VAGRMGSARPFSSLLKSYRLRSSRLLISPVSGGWDRLPGDPPVIRFTSSIQHHRGLRFFSSTFTITCVTLRMTSAFSPASRRRGLILMVHERHIGILLGKGSREENRAVHPRVSTGGNFSPRRVISAGVEHEEDDVGTGRERRPSWR